MSESLTCQQIFHETMPQQFNAEAADDWETNVQFEIAGEGGGEWTVTVADGECQIQDGKVGEPAATVRTDAETYTGIYSGEVNPQVAFMNGKISADNLPEMMRFMAVFRPGA